MDGGQGEVGGGLELEGEVVHVGHGVRPEGHGQVDHAVNAGQLFVGEEVFRRGGRDGADFCEVVHHASGQGSGEGVGVEVDQHEVSFPKSRVAGSG